MIFVILGTQDKPFNRLLKAIEKLVEDGKIKENVIVQAGSTKLKNKKIIVYDLISQEMFDKMIKEASLIITHAGVGSILTALKENKKVIVAAREKKYNEHTNNHQIQIRDRFVSEGYVLGIYNSDFSDLESKIKEIKTKTLVPYIFKNQDIINLIENYIDNGEV